MKIKIQIKSIFGKVLFEFEKENNTIKDTVEEAIKNKVNLSYANLRDADLRDAINIDESNMPMFSKWSFSIQGNKLNIGCKTKTFEEWSYWFENSSETYETPRDSEEFKRIRAMFYAYYEYNKIINEK